MCLLLLRGSVVFVATGILLTPVTLRLKLKATLLFPKEDKFKSYRLRASC